MSMPTYSFLNDASRIATNDYQPTDDDVVRARLRTLGVQEHRFVFEQGRTAGREWVMYDVGGTRSSVRDISFSSSYPR